MATVKPIENHRDLIAWQKAIALASEVYAATRKLPTEERDGLASQLRRAAVSIPSNIAEAVARRNRPEFLQFLHTARGSLSELETQLMIASAQQFIDDRDPIIDMTSEVGCLLNGLIRSLACHRRESHAAACAPDPGIRHEAWLANR